MKKILKTIKDNFFRPKTNRDESSDLSAKFEKIYNSKPWLASIANFDEINNITEREKYHRGSYFKIQEDSRLFLQINIDELPYIPKRIEKFKIITILIELNRFFSKGDSKNFFQVETYSSLNNLELREKATDENWIYYKIKWSLAKDNADFEYDEGANNFDEKLIPFNENNFKNTKVGGWPSIIQEELLMNYDDFILQIGSDLAINLNLIDGGIFYLGYDDREWLLEFQFY